MILQIHCFTKSRKAEQERTENLWFLVAECYNCLISDLINCSVLLKFRYKMRIQVVICYYT